MHKVESCIGHCSRKEKKGKPPILVVKEDVLALIASGDDMIQSARIMNT